MNLEILMVGMVILAICIIPFVLMGMSKKKKAKDLIDALNGFATKHQCIISEYEPGGDFIFGLDAKKKVLFYYKKALHANMIEKMDLSQVKHCRAVTSGSEVKTSDGTKKLTDKIELVFTFASKDMPEVRWTIFDTQHEMVLMEEHQLVERWAARINSLLKS